MPSATSGSSPELSHLTTVQNTHECCINHLKQWRGLASRYEKRAVNYRALVAIAALMMWRAS